MLGAADVRVIFINAERVASPTDDIPLPARQARARRRPGQRESSIRTLVPSDGVRYRVATVPTGSSQALVLAQSLARQGEDAARSSAPCCSSRRPRRAGGGARRLGGRDQRPAARTPPRPPRSSTSPSPRTSRRCRSRATTRSRAWPRPSTRCSGARRLARPPTAARRRRQPRAPHPAHLAAHQPRPARQADGDAALPAEARRELLDDVRGQIEELTTLVGDLVVLAREEPPEVRRRPRPRRGGRSRGDARTPPRCRGRLRRRLEPWPVEGDSTGLERAITNLLDNAAKWSPAGGTITVRLAAGVLIVDDQGPGINAADLPHVFERFWRSEESRSMPGSGLGLAIVQQVVDQHGGRVEVSGRRRRGAVVAVDPGVGRCNAECATPDAQSGSARNRRYSRPASKTATAARPSTATRPTPRRGRTAP